MVVEPYNGELGALSKLLGSIARDVKASRPTFWPRPRNSLASALASGPFDLGLKLLVSASNFNI